MTMAVIIWLVALTLLPSTPKKGGYIQGKFHRKLQMGLPQLTKHLQSQKAIFTLDVCNEDLEKLRTRIHTLDNIKDEPKIPVAVPKHKLRKDASRAPCSIQNDYKSYKIQVHSDSGLKFQNKKHITAQRYTRYITIIFYNQI